MVRPKKNISKKLKPKHLDDKEMEILFTALYVAVCESVLSKKTESLLTNRLEEINDFLKIKKKKV